ncbi:MAG: hypothetical protein ACREEW_15635 [Caulobacteraceae bacterium]
MTDERDAEAARGEPLRIAIIGLTGSGKSTMAKALGAALGLPVIELDAINWQPGWRDLKNDDPAQFARRVEAVIQKPRWVTDGNYSVVLPRILARATTVVWLDYGRPLIMGRVIRRSLVRSITKKEVWPGTGNRELWRSWLSAEHPVIWAWRTYRKRRARYEAAFASPALAHLTVHRLRHPREAGRLVERLKAEFAAS